MPYTHKAQHPFSFPAQGEVRELTPGKSYASGEVRLDETIYVFVENSRPHVSDSHLVARGRIVGAHRTASSWRLQAEFDGIQPRVPLLRQSLRPYCRLPDGPGTRGGVEHSELTDIAEIARRTTFQPLHRIRPESATWLDHNHF